MTKVLIMSGYGINCEEETAHAFKLAGGDPEIVHINDLIAKEKKLDSYQILAFPGGFSYGDDTGSGKAFANRVRNNLWEELLAFLEKDTLCIGICNGFQILTNLGILPALNNEYGKRQVALEHNTQPRYLNRWVDVQFENNSPWTKDITQISLPIAHGEGRFYAEEHILRALNEKKMIAARYVQGEVCLHTQLEPNPNGSLENIAAITTGRILGMMPHPERAIHFTQHPFWTYLKEKYKREGTAIPVGPGLQLFNNGIKYFK
jgi:phosphoribosylformylglycinamidine synthase subunit PurQ / glutaminase